MVSKKDIIRGVKNASYLTIGDIVGRIIALISFVYITRMLGPYDYGIYATVGAFVGFFVLFSFGGLRRVVLRESCKDVDGMSLILERTIGLRIFFIIFSMILCIIASYFTNYDSQVKFYIIVFSAEIFIIGFEGFFSIVFQAHEKMNYLAILGVLGRLISSISVIAVLYFGYGLLTLIITNLIVNLVLMLNKVYISRRFTKFRLVFKPNFDSQIIKAAFVFTLISFVNVLVTRIDVLMISILGTIEEAGIYAVAYKLALEGIFLRNMASTAFFPISVKFYNENKIKSSVLLGYSLLFFTVAFIFAFVAGFFIERLIIFAFGNDYSDSAQVLKILIFFLAFVWATLPYTISATSTHNEDIILYSSIIMAVLHIPLNIIMFYSYGIIGIAYSLLIVYFIGSILQCSFIHRRLKETGYMI